MADGSGDGIYFSNTSAQRLAGDLFERDARGQPADAWQQQATAALPDMLRQAQQDEAQRQAAIDAVRQQQEQQRQQAEQAQRDQAADQFEAQAPSIIAQHPAVIQQQRDDAAAKFEAQAPAIIAQHLASLAPTSGDSLTNPLAAALRRHLAIELGDASKPTHHTVPARH